MDRKIIVDIDNTLWDFCHALYEQLKVANNQIPSPKHWADWSFWQGYCSEEDFWAAVRFIHLNQNNHKYVPYSDAKGFLSTLKEQNFCVIIASHRVPESHAPTHHWLTRHGLQFDELHISFDKTVLFNSSCKVVVDDEPFILKKAAKKGILCTGLLLPWTKNKCTREYRLFDNLNEVLEYILDSTVNSR